MQFLKLFLIYRWYALVFAFMYVALIYLICRKTKFVKAVSFMGLLQKLSLSCRCYFSVFNYRNRVLFQEYQFSSSFIIL